MKKYIALLVLICGINGYAQTTGQNVVFQITQPSITQTANALVTYTSNAIQNIGQTNHVLIFSYTSKTGSSNNIVTMQLEGSVDNTNWLNLGPILQSVPVISHQVKAYGYGAYPYIRTVVEIATGSASTVTFSINYVGTSIPVNSLIDADGVQLAMSSYNNKTLTTGGVDTIAISAPQFQTISVYGLGIFSDATGTTLDLKCSSSSSSSSNTLTFSNIGVTRSIIIPTQIRPMMACGYATGLSSGGSPSINYSLAGTPVASMFIIYRIE